MATKNVSSDRLTKIAVNILHNRKSSTIQKSLAGSVLSQTVPKKVTSSRMASQAGKVLGSHKYNTTTKVLAGCVLN